MALSTGSPAPQPKPTTAERRAARAAEVQREQRQRRRRNTAVAVVAAIVVVAVVGFLIRRQLTLTAGVQSFEGVTQGHVQGTVAYAQTPPVGGDHAATWQNCGYYDAPVASENGVHSLEHGAVWVTYRPDLPAAQVERLRNLARGQTYLLVTPFAGLPAPVVASAWGKQVLLDGAEDPRLAAFVRSYRSGPQAPEPGAPCTSGTGVPK